MPMSLRNLLGRSLDEVTPDRATIARLLAAARRNLADARIKALSAENRFDAGYKAILQLAMAALHAHGYRTLTSKPGHHQTALQTLPLTVGLDQSKVIVLDALRKQRNLADYGGEPVTDAAATECLACAQELQAHVLAWLRVNRADLV
jgi:hypothetical protein